MHGCYQYALVLVDDHTRFKSIPFRRNNLEAPTHVCNFIASFTALVNKRATRPARVVGTLHSDNAGEFLSREFTELLFEQGVHSSTCPPHVHQLNGVAERAIRTIMNLRHPRLPRRPRGPCHLLGLRIPASRRHSQPHYRAAEHECLVV
eukprot:6179626-Pleurochrysis_carterae.AAC.1